MLSFELLDKRNLLSISPSSPIDVESSDSQTQIAATSNSPSAQPAAATTITSVRDGLWSNPATWSAGRVPTSTDDVVITNNVTIDQASVHQLDINAGTTTLAGTLQAYGSVVVRGSLVGTQGGIFFHVADDRLDTGNTKPGPQANLPDFHPEDVGLWALPGSHVDLHGEQVSSWLNAVGSGPLQSLGHGVSQQVAFGAGAATLQSAPVGWRVGDTLLLVNEHGQSVLADLVSINGASIQYHERKAQPNDPNLVAHTMITQGTNAVVYPKIADLSRRMQIASADVHEGDTHHRAFTAALSGANFNLTNVELRDLGPRAKLGRYPVYFEHAAAGSGLVGSSLWQDVTDPGNRFVALQNSQGINVQGNVAFRAQGEAFFMEDSNDYNNSIAGNLSVAVTGGEELSHPDSNVSDETHHYWLRSGNTITGNVAAGGDAIGMIILASSHPTSAPVVGTETFGTGLWGMWTGTPNVSFNNAIAVYNERAGFAAEPAWDVDSHGATLNNPLLLFNGADDSSYGSQVYSNNGDDTQIVGGVLAGNKGFHTHYHSSITASGAIIDVDTLLVPTYWEQAAIFDHDQIRAQLLFERSYPSPRYASPGLARIIASQLQVGTDPVELETADYMGDMFQNYPTIPGKPMENGIELDHPAPDSGFIRVTMLSDADRWMTNIARWTVTPIGQTPVADSFIYHRQTAWTHLAKYGGYPDGFPPGPYAVKLYDDNGVLLKSGFVTVRSDQVSDITDTLDTGTQIVGRQLFYNQSKFDGNTPGVSASDDAAIAGDKTAYLPGSGPATFANVSSYSKGINGIMIDVAGAHGAITAADFVFKVGNNNTPSTWAAAPAPLAVSVRAGAGIGGSDRVEIVWTAGAIPSGWLEVVTLANSRTGLSQNAALPTGQADVFFFGNAPGDSGQGDTATLATVNATDELAARTHASGPFQSVPVTNLYDYNRDGKVNSTDQVIVRTATAATTRFISIGPTPAAPAAAPAVEGELSTASLTLGLTTPSPTATVDKPSLQRTVALPVTNSPAHSDVTESATVAAARELLFAKDDVDDLSDAVDSDLALDPAGCTTEAKSS